MQQLNLIMFSEPLQRKNGWPTCWRRTQIPGSKIGFLSPHTGLSQSEMEQTDRQFFDPAGIVYHWEIYPADTTDFGPYIHGFEKQAAV